MSKPLIMAARVGLAGNIFLFLLKLTAGVMSNSIAVISDALNSLSDIASSIAIHISVKMSSEKPDEDHPFGHNRAEPVAGLIVAIMSAILGFSVISAAFGRFAANSDKPLQITTFTFAAMIITIAVKIVMSIHFRKVCLQYDSPAIKASEIDSRNDVLVSLVALTGITGATFDIPGLDGVMASAIGIQIISSGYEVGKRNIDFLIGKAPEQELIDTIKKCVDSVDAVEGFHDVRAHYVGNIVQVEIHILLDETLSLIEAHNIGKEVQFKVEDIGNISKAFIHIDPV